MLKKLLCTLAMPATLLFAYAVPAGANAPPPPVNQFIGIDDTQFDNFVEATCRACHEDTSVVDPGTIPVRHHLLIGEVIPDPTDVPVGLPGGTYACMSCHKIGQDANGTWGLLTFRDCLYCHQQTTATTVHHRTAKAIASDCKACHGPIDNPGDGHYIPDDILHPISSITPSPSSDHLPATQDPPGNCTYCHAAGIDTSTGGNIAVFSNADTHHGIGLVNAAGDPFAKCTVCHTGDITMRLCEACHGIKSLHNIQVDSDDADAVIIPGTEASYYGHIGSNEDCMGCHNFTGTSDELPAIVIQPNISSVSPLTVTAGFATELTISGAGITNAGDTIVTSIRLTPGDGSEPTTLTPDTNEEDTIVVTIPATMATGNYALSAVKSYTDTDGSASNVSSNSVNLSIKPAVVITSASCANGIVSITGSGFSQYVNAYNSGTSVSLSGALADCNVLSWTDTAIGAKCGVCDSTIDVESIFGEASGVVNVKQSVITKPSRR
ncbi:MAG: hypothetical protein MUO63_08695 [Desulfobulbaceae bacterium]|nr:hypothetical protein [Desulfobulbaceae bacterium]